MKHHLRLSLPTGLNPIREEFEPLKGGHEDELAELMLDAYKGTVDYEGESLEEAKEEISNLLAGKYGNFLKEHSFLCRVEGKLASATLVTLEEGIPLLAFSMTRAEYKRQGYAKLLISATTDSLEKAGYRSLDLWVTESNHPAINLYRQLGFKDV